MASYSVSQNFEDNDDSVSVLKKRIDAVEKFQNEFLRLLNQLTTINTSRFYSTQLPNKNRTQKPIDSDIVDEKAGDIVENTKREQTESESTTIKDDSPSTVTPSTNMDEETVYDETKVNEKETLTSSKIEE